MPVNVALVGYGYWGVNIARNLATVAATRLAGIVEGDSERRRAAAADHPSVPTADDLAAVLADDEVDAVVIATPAGTHGPLGLQVIAAGRHVLIEKPLATSVPEARTLVDAARNAGVRLMAGHTFLYSEPVRWLRRAIEDGLLGIVQYLSFQRLSLGRIRTDCNVLWSLAPHDISIANHLLGESPHCASATMFSYLQPDLGDVCFGTLAYPSGIGVGIHVSWLDPRKTRSLTIVGSEKMVVYNDVSVDEKIRVYDSSVARHGELGEYGSFGDFHWRTRAGDVLIPRIALREPLANEMEEFAASIIDQREPLTHGEHGLEVVATLEALDRSAQKTGQQVGVEW